MTIPATISGPYTATYNAKAVGMTRDGFRLSHEHFKRMITADQFGDTPLNSIYRGRAQFVEFEIVEAAAAAIAEMIEPYTSVTLALGAIGQSDMTIGSCTGASKALVLTRIGTGCNTTPASLTLNNVILAENYPVNILYGSDLRQIPVRLRSYPALVSTAMIFGTIT
jgi:hypothetical protein